MNATEARQLLLIRACETAGPAAAAWSAADGAWASNEALRLEGEHCPPERWLVRRAELAIGRLAQRDPAWAAVSGPQPWLDHAWITALPVAVALLVGLGSNVIGPSQQVNLLLPPLLGVLMWNLAVYALMAVHAIASRVPARPGIPAQPASGGWIRPWRWLSQQSTRAFPTSGPALRSFASDWARTSQGLQTARLTTVMHLAAAALAAGALGGLYLRGLAFEFRAGWDSTFLGADTVRAWLALLLGPAAWLSGWSLPDATQLEALRFSHGSGENAARWIHLYAITTALLVLLPRTLLAGSAAWRAHRLARDLPVSLADPYFQRLLRHLAHALPGAPRQVMVLPYSYQLDSARQAALATALADDLGPQAQLTWLASVPLGGEDALADHWPVAAANALAASPPAVVVTLFALTATPERETHGAFLTAVQSRCAAMRPVTQCLVAIDESGYRMRLAGADLAERLAQRREAWRTVVDPLGEAPPLFIDLGATTARAE